MPRNLRELEIPAREDSTRKNLAMDSKQEILEGAEPKMRSRYSFKGGQRGRYANLFPQNPGLIVLSPDMAAVFPDSDSVNEALRTLVKAVQGAAVPLEREAA